MSTRDQVYKLKRELAFWESVHEHEPHDSIELALARRIQMLSNCDQFGQPRYDGTIDEDDPELMMFEGRSHDYGYCSTSTCRYCGKSGLHWMLANGKWRLANTMNEVHACGEYQGAKRK